MSLKKICAALLAVLAISALAVSSASAVEETPTTTRAEWYVGTTETNVATLAETKTKEIKAKVAESPVIGNKFLLVSEVGTGPTKIELTATGIECVSCTIENKPITEKAGAAAFATGKLKFTGVTAMLPTTCTVSDENGLNPGTVTTKQLNVHADLMASGERAIQQFIPTAGVSKSFAAFTLEGASCPVAGLYSVTGTLYGVASNKTGVAAKTQGATVTPAIEKELKGGLFIGTKPAELTGKATFFLNPEEFFSVKP